MRTRLRLRQQLMLSYVPLLLIPILVIGIITRNAAESGLTLLVTEQGNRQANVLANRFAAYYNQHHSWNGVNDLFTAPTGAGEAFVSPPLGFIPPVPSSANNAAPNANPAAATNPQPRPGRAPPIFQLAAEQILLTDASGVVIASNAQETEGRSLSPQTVAQGVIIHSNGQTVGVVVVGAALGVLDEAQQQLLDSVNRALLIAGLISAVVTIVIGLWLSGQISSPIAALTRGVRVLATGQWSQHIRVYNDDELGELTQAFNHMADDLMRQQTLRKQLMADIAHDLRTPLSVMMLEIEGIQAGLQTPEEAAQSLHDEVEWLSRLVNDLHTLSLIDAGQLTIQPEPTDLNIFLESVYKHWRTAAEGQQRELILERNSHLPIVTIDPPRMRQVLGNLINNAIQHTPAEASIRLKAEIEGQQVFIRVIDTGQGIPADALPHLFERFYRIDRSRSRKLTSGSGLGLSIAYQLTALQGGNLSVQSEVGKGTTFTIRLGAA